MVAQFQLQLFGSPQLVRGRALVRFRTKKHLAVLLYLHFEGRARAISRDRLVDLLWPDVPADKGRHSLSQALLAIRSRLGTDAVTGREQDVQLLAELPSELSALRQGQLATVRVGEPLLGLDECAPAASDGWSAVRDLGCWLNHLRSASGSSGRAHSSPGKSSWDNWKRSGVAWAAPLTRRA